MAGAEAALHPVDRPSAVAAVIALGVVGSIVFLILPFLVGAFSEELSLGSKQVGYLGSADMLGMFAAAVLATLWVRRFDWQRVAALSLVALVACHGASTLTSSFGALAGVRILAGLAGGSLMAIALTGLGDTRHPDRYFALFIAGQLGLGSLLLWLMPAVVGRFGLNGIFSALVALTAAAGLLVPSIPRRGRPVAIDGGSRREAGRLGPGVAALVACWLFNLGIMAVWAFMERIGTRAGLTGEQIGGSLGLSLLAGLGGALLAAALVDRFGREIPLASTLALQLLALFLVAGRPSAMEFAVGATLFSFCWNFPVAYQLAITVRVDPSGRMVVLFLGAVKLGYALGPAAVGGLLAPAAGYAPAIGFGAVCFVASSVIFLALARRAAREASAGTAGQEEAV